jgi:hypothetical protein
MNTNRLPFVLRLIPLDKLAAEFAQLPQRGAVRGELAPQTGTPSTPMTYSIAGKQYLVIAAGGHGKIGTKLGDYVLAFTLP